MMYLKAVPWNLLAVLAMVGGCEQGQVSIGEAQDAQVKSGPNAFVGNWDGYVEAYSFLDGTDQVRITINGDGTAMMRLGKQDLWPLPTDPNSDFLPRLEGYDYTKQWASSYFFGEPLVGFNYTLNDIRLDEQRIRTSGWTNEAYDRWCGLQTPNLNVNLTPIDSIESRYRCGPDCNIYKLGSSLDAGLQSNACYTFDVCPTGPAATDWLQARKQVSCDQIDLCDRNFCICDANACSLDATARTNDIGLDATLEDNQQSLVGTLVLPMQSNSRTSLTFRLKRQ